MAVALNAGAGFTSPVRSCYCHRFSDSVGLRVAIMVHTRQHPVLRSLGKLPFAKPTLFGSNSCTHGSRRLFPNKRRVVISGKETDDNAITAVDSPPPDSGSQPRGDVDGSPLASKSVEAGNGSGSSAARQTNNKRASLTARERLRAARVLGRYAETAAKPEKSEMGSKLLDVLKESDKKAMKKPGLPEAPTNLFDDSKRGLAKGFTFQFPGGNDILIIAFSFVFISTVMFATTYLVWKLGAIHFNEY